MTTSIFDDTVDSWYYSHQDYVLFQGCQLCHFFLKMFITMMGCLWSRASFANVIYLVLATAGCVTVWLDPALVRNVLKWNKLVDTGSLWIATLAIKARKKISVLHLRPLTGPVYRMTGPGYRMTGPVYRMTATLYDWPNPSSRTL